MMLKMALRFSTFDPYSEEFPFKKKDLLKAFDEVKTALGDETLLGIHGVRYQIDRKGCLLTSQLELHELGL